MNGEGRLLRPKLKFERDFTQVPNTWLRDDNLTFKARGLLAMLMSHDAGWNVTVKSLAATSIEGKAAIRTALAELEEHGYLVRSQTRNHRGQLGHVWWELTDPSERRPETQTPLTDFPTTDNPTTAKPPTDNRTTIEEHLKEHLLRATEPTIDARGSKEDASGDPRPVATESAAERYQRLVHARCPRSGREHDWAQSGYCNNCATRRPELEEVLV